MGRVKVKWIKVAQIGDLPSGEGKTVDCLGNAIALFNDGCIFKAIENECPHAGGSLGEGMLSDGCVVCPLHQWTFCLENGRFLRNESVRLKTYPTKVEGEDVFVALD